MAAVLQRASLMVTPVLRIRGSLSVTTRYHGTSSTLQQKPAVAAEVEDSADVVIKPVSEVPGPPSYPIVKSLFSMLMDKDFDNKRVHIWWKKMVDTYGPIVRLESPVFPDMVMLSDPDDAEKVTRVTMDNPIRIGFLSLAKIRKDNEENYFDKKGGLLTENEEEWKRVRSRVQTPMMKAKNVTSYLTQQDQVTLDFMDKIAELQKINGEMPEEFLTELYKWALESVGLVALNRRLGCLESNLADDSEPMILIREANNIFDALNDTEFSAHLWRWFPTKAYKKLEKSHEEFLRVADQNIRETEAQLLAKADKQSGQEDLTLMETLLLTPGLRRSDVVTLILDMLFAGIDTTSNTIGFTLYQLSKNPECQVKLQEEVDSVLGDLQGPLTSKHLAQLSYLKAVVKEVLRFYPLAVGTVRTLTSDVVLQGYLIPKGYAAASLNMFMGQDEKYFPRPKEFIPERWLRHKPLGPIHPFASLPFGAGTRMCIGRRIAEQEIYTFLARVMQRYTVDYKHQDMDIVTRLVISPSEPLRFNFTERK